LLAWLQVRAAGGQFVMRIEDLDLGRSRVPFETGLLHDLRWLGLDWDEGPDVGGSAGPYRQSERFERYAEALARLDTFDCTCSRKEVRDATLAPHSAEPVYPGTCRDGIAHRQRPRAVRWRTPSGVVEVVDAIMGSWAQDVATEVGDFVLRRSDGGWAYQLAVVIDDAAMGITDVLRGADLWTSTPRQVLLQRTLEMPTPRYAHVPLLCGSDGEKLSKRHGAPSLATLRESGADPGKVVAMLAQSLGLVDRAVRSLRATELVGAFSWDDVRADAGTFDLALLR
jgi:glutamyl-tRNA synthetase